MTVIPANIPKTFSPHNAKWLVSQSRLEKIHKRFTGTAAILDPQVGLTHSTDVVCTILFLSATSFNSFHFLSIGNTLTCTLQVPAKSKQHFDWRVMDVSRLHINEGARQNKQWSSCRRYLFLFPACPIFPSTFPFLAPAMQAKLSVVHVFNHKMSQPVDLHPLKYTIYTWLGYMHNNSQDMHMMISMHALWAYLYVYVTWLDQ